MEFDAHIDLISDAPTLPTDLKNLQDNNQRAHETTTTVRLENVLHVCLKLANDIGACVFVAHDHVKALLLRAHDALMGVDSLRRFLLDICSCIAESSASESSYAKGALRTLEKHG